MRHPAAFAAAALLLPLLQDAALRAGEQAEPPGAWIVQVPLAEPHEALRLEAYGDSWGNFPLQGFARVAVDAAGFARLVADGYTPWVEDFAPRVHLAAPSRGAGDTIPGFPCFRTVEATLAAGNTLTTARPDLAQWVDVGDSWERTVGTGGYDLQVLRLTQTAVPGPKPVLFVSASLHPRELATAELATRFAETLVTTYGVDPDVTWLLDHHEVHVLLQANPDGRKRAETGLPWRKNTNNLYCPDSDTRGADLNRNFSFQWACCGGPSSDPCSPAFRGASAASEPETAALEAYLRAVFPDQRPDDLVTPAPSEAGGLVIDLHSPGEQVLGSWGFTTDPAPNALELTTLARKLAFPGGYFPLAGSLSTVEGAAKDFAYGALGVPAFTFELGTDFAQACPLFELAIVPQQLAALRSGAQLVRQPWREAAGPEISALTGPGRILHAGELVTVSATVDDTRFSTANGLQPNEPIASVEATVDAPPWLAATAYPLVAADGAFDTAIEGATGAVPTTGLAPGRHTLFVRGRDASGTWGPPRAVFFDLAQPVSDGKLTGTVRDGDTGAPRQATLTAGRFTTLSAVPDGRFRLELPVGGWAVTATAPGYAPHTTPVQLAPRGELNLDLQLSPYRTVLFEDAEGVGSGWTAAPPWARTGSAAATGAQSWTDSPAGNYTSPGTDAAFTSPLFDLRRAIAVRLTWAERFDITRSFDLGQVEISTDGGSTWEVVALTTGNSATTWRTVSLDLPQLAGQATARVRFRLVARSLLPRDGWYLDDIRLEEARRPAQIFADGFESGGAERWGG